MLSRQQTISTHEKKEKENDDDTVYANIQKFAASVVLNNLC
jgi:hypothetical protein